MHLTAMSNARLFFETYVSKLGQVSVIDVGAQDVTGSLREACPPSAKYTGIDFVAGKGVDVVLTDPYRFPFKTDSVDVVVSSSCFEHSQMFWLLFLEILRVLKPAGLFYLNAPSNGGFHRYPVDCWRFYPDSGNALVAWARKSGIKAALLESYISYQNISHQSQEVWNDFVGVFVKDEQSASRYPDRILHKFKDFYNGTILGQEGILNVKDPEDMMKMQALSGILQGTILAR